MITEVRLRKFKRFKNETVRLLPSGITLLAGGNNSGKSTLLHGLAVWEFCRTAIEMEKGSAAFYVGAKHQGLGMGNDEFSPVAVPSLKHLWTNLRPQRSTADGEKDGYTLRIACKWLDEAGQEFVLEFGLALANDRLFVKVTETNLVVGTKIPVIAYLPPFAGITNHEMKVSPAIRRRRIGEGLAGAVLRNLLLELFEENDRTRSKLKANSKGRLKQSDLNKLRSSDPWELLQQTLRKRFNTELIVEPFKEQYHSYIKIELEKGELKGFLLKRFPNYVKRDLMVEGSGFLQWLSVYALAASPTFDVLLLDEPDAHLHPTLQLELMHSLGELVSLENKQVLVATHSVELLRHWPIDRIMQVSSKRPTTRYLSENFQKTGLLAGLGSEYGPNLDPIRKTKRVLFIEGTSDKTILESIAGVLGRTELNDWPIWINNKDHSDRRQLFMALQEDIPDLVGVSLRDRDVSELGSVDEDLSDKGYKSPDSAFVALKWRRRNIDSYMLHPAPIARTVSASETDISKMMADVHGLAVGASFTEKNPPTVFMEADGKKILHEGGLSSLLSGTHKTTIHVAQQLTVPEVCEDFTTFFDRLQKATVLP